MQVAIQMSNWQLAVLIVLPSLVTVAAWLNNNARIGDISTQLVQFRQEIAQRFGLVDQRFLGMDQGFRDIDQRFRDVNQRLDVLTGIVNDIDKRVTRVEARLHME